MCKGITKGHLSISAECSDTFQLLRQPNKRRCEKQVCGKGLTVMDKHWASKHGGVIVSLHFQQQVTVCDRCDIKLPKRKGGVNCEDSEF